MAASRRSARCAITLTVPGFLPTIWATVRVSRPAITRSMMISAERRLAILTPREPADDEIDLSVLVPADGWAEALLAKFSAWQGPAAGVSKLLRHLATAAGNRYPQTYALMKERHWTTNFLGPHDGGYDGHARSEFSDADLTAVFDHYAIDPGDHYGDINRCSTDRVAFHRTGDRSLSVIVSKAVLLAADDKITDPTILQQLKRR